MATYNVELRQRISGTFGDTIYLKANWNNIDNKPFTFTPTAHAHGNVTNDGKIGTTAGLIIKTGTSGLLEALAAGSSGQFLGHDGTWKDLPTNDAQDIAFDNTISELTATTVKGAIDEIDGRLDNIVDGTTVIEESYNSNTILIHDLTYVVNGDFKANLKTIYEDKIVFVKFPNTSSTSTLRVSLDNGVTYYNVVKNGKTMQAFIASGQLVRLEFDGTQFIADIQGDVDVEATYGEPVESTYGEFAPLDGGVPLVTEIQGLLLDAPQLVESGEYTYIGTSNQTNYILPLQSTKIKYYEYIQFTQIPGAVINFFLREIDINGNYVQDKKIQDFLNVITPFSGIIDTYRLTNRITGISNGYTYISKAWNISTLITNKQYSPLYSTTFDLMSDAQIKAQMDLWVQNGTLPSEIQAVSNTTLQSVGKNLHGGNNILNDRVITAASTGAMATNTEFDTIYVRVKEGTIISTQGYTNSEGSRLSYVFYDINGNRITSGSSPFNITVPNGAYYFGRSVAKDKVSIAQTELGSKATTYEPYKSSTQTFTHGPLRSCITDGTIRDRIYYNDGQYLLDQYVDTDGTALTTPLLGTPVDVDGLLLQDDVTTIYQLQDLATTYKVQFALNTEQTVKTLVERDRLQQGEIDSNEANIVTLTARKTTTNDIIIMSETAWSTYTQVTGEVYGVYNETTFVITWYYGQTE